MASGKASSTPSTPTPTTKPRRRAPRRLAAQPRRGGEHHPTSTGAAKAVGDVLPALRGRLDGIASRVPVLDGSVVDLFVELDESTSVEAVHEAMRAAAASERLDKVLEVTDEPVVSSDVIGNPHSSIFDASFTQLNGRFLKALAWYDNEWGYSNRVCDLLELLETLD